MPEAVSIFLMPPTPEILATRLRNRSRAEGIAQDEVIRVRLAKAKQEIENYREYGYILVNDILDQAVEEMTAIVTAERVRRNGFRPDRPADAQRLIEMSENCRLVNSTAKIRPVLRAFGVPESEIE
jgi:guanylate kinase